LANKFKTPAIVPSLDYIFVFLYSSLTFIPLTNFFVRYSQCVVLYWYCNYNSSLVRNATVHPCS